ncbi:MAG: Glucose-1-phosphate thymidylyltransferase, partial [uncultured Gemmatimonadaceae bacterium]
DRRVPVRRRARAPVRAVRAHATRVGAARRHRGHPPPLGARARRARGRLPRRAAPRSVRRARRAPGRARNAPGWGDRGERALPPRAPLVRHRDGRRRVVVRGAGGRGAAGRRYAGRALRRRRPRARRAGRAGCRARSGRGPLARRGVGTGGHAHHPARGGHRPSRARAPYAGGGRAAGAAARDRPRRAGGHRGGRDGRAVHGVRRDRGADPRAARRDGALVHARDRPVLRGRALLGHRRPHRRLLDRRAVPRARRDLDDGGAGSRQQEPRRLRGPLVSGAVGEPRRGHHHEQPEEHLRHRRALDAGRRARHRPPVPRLAARRPRQDRDRAAAHDGHRGGRGRQRVWQRDAGQARAPVRVGRGRRARRVPAGQVPRRGRPRDGAARRRPGGRRPRAARRGVRPRPRGL